MPGSPPDQLIRRARPALWVYRIALYACLPFVIVHLIVRALRNPAYWRRWAERFGFANVAHGPYLLWVHAVSVGEVRVAVPLVKAVRARFPAGRILVTTMTPTGSVQVRQSLGDTVEHCYAPYDFPGAVRRFLSHVEPGLAVIMETEIWPHIISQCAERRAPSVFANLRLSAKSCRRYRRVRWLLRPILEMVTAFAVQTRADADRIVSLGARRDAVSVTASIKFEVALPASLREVADGLRREWGRDRRVWVAGSTHDGEEELLLDVYERLRRDVPDLLLVIVPRHPERFSTVVRMCRRRGHTVRRHTDVGPRPTAEVEVYVGDTMGELPIFYAAGDVAFVGGSLVPIGGHNVLEPCAVGVPVVFGPHMHNFGEIALITVQRGAGQQVSDGAELEHVVARYLSDANLRFQVGETGRSMVAENRGALGRTVAVLEPYLAAASKQLPLTSASR